ncbi:MAG: quinone-dependent dihydroorotate dehydrogenase [Deltaproteobacteria bacterium]|nr:quinone-dependent dihydroorotate dehydrogenase [Deltaproteobacteria bacterium]
MTPAPPTPASWRLARKLLFSIDAERVHHLAMASLSVWSRVCSVDLPSTDVARAPALQVQAFGLTFPNPLGLAAGFDKDAVAVPAWQALGFGFLEVGTVTAQAQPGNERPRLFRLPADRALKNRMGFNNQGAAACARHLERWRTAGRVRVPVGVNIGKTKVVDNAHAADDYRASFAAVADVADYVVVNVSSPNTPGLRALQQKDELLRVLDVVCGDNAKRQVPRPILVKLAPDLAIEDARGCADAAVQAGCRGLVLTNTTIDPTGLVGPVPEGSGGISGAPLFARSTELLRALAGEYQGKLAFMGAGGIEDGATLEAKLDAGAVLAQAYTGFVYGGPGFVRRALRELVARRGSTAGLVAPITSADATRR